MNAKDALAAIEVGGPQTPKTGPQDEQKWQKRERTDHPSSNDMASKGMTRLVKWYISPLVMPIDQILMQIKNNHQLKWLKPLSGSPNAWNKKKYYQFHRDHGHYTDECRNLKEQVEELI